LGLTRATAWVLLAYVAGIGLASLWDRRTVFTTAEIPWKGAMVTFIDVGLGDAVLIQAGDEAVLVGAGDLWAGPRVVAELQRSGVESLSLVVCNGGDSGQLGGMEAVFREFPVSLVLGTHPTSHDEAYRQFMRALEDRGVIYRKVSVGDSFRFGNAAKLRFLAPIEDPLGQEVSAGGLAVLFEVGTVRFLFLYGLDVDGEEQLVRLNPDLDVDVLKVPKHGHKDATGSLLLESFMPETAIITVGIYNELLLPSVEVLNRLERQGISVYRTDKHGTIRVITDGIRYEVIVDKKERAWGGTVLADTVDQ